LLRNPDPGWRGSYMVNAIITGVSEKLKEAFGDGYRIYTENELQDFKEPYFNVACINSVYKPMLGARHSRTHSLLIKYAPKSKARPQAECYDISDGLYMALEHIAVGGVLTRGANMNCSFDEGQLEFAVDYDVIVQEVDDSEMMEEMSLTMNRAT